MKRLTGIILLALVALGMWAQTDSLLPYPIDTIKHQAVYRYKVEKSIGLWRISQNFGVTQDEILKLNPQLKDRGLHYDEEILIPVNVRKGAVLTPQSEPKKPAAEITPAPAPIQAETKAVIKEEVVIEPVAQPVAVDEMVTADSTQATPAAENASIHIGVLLPLHADNPKRNPNMDRFVDFYAGILLAFNNRFSSAFPYTIHTWDIEKSDAAMRRVLADTTLRQCDVIIGPAYNAQVALAAEYAKTNHILTMIPFTQSVPGIEENEYLIQFNPSAQDEADAMGRYLLSHKDSIHCILIDAEEGDIPESIRMMRRAIMTNGCSYSTTSIHAILSDSIDRVLSSTRENVILFNTERYSNLSTLMPHLLSTSKRITLLSRYSWQKEKIILPQIYTAVFSEDSTYRRDEYQLLYQTYAGWEVATDLPRYDILGFDLAQFIKTYFTELLHGEMVLTQNSEALLVPYEGIQSTIRLKKLTNGGYKNVGIRIVRK